ncbi:MULTISPECIES: hypothetical protein [Serratia]|uniref:Uncharacterized protein n=1 Tax=Serratia symbiotica TaxID=138074 RepID=A0A068Z2D1_9GAMM|nr:MULTISPECIES: hypothetical protein [Serratia]MBH2715667.1 hypothetical protein [Serratia marcescens]MBN5446662.1 hypothetical protein [Serratia ureilytica]QLH62880.1 hypothetical protein SYMBAF_07970 [Serratia symbiotica]CDS57617.1 conserved hypothetical protein [Serratia symbiotica]HBC7418183.1 hypothetical protein [Serratia marcescens]
MSDDQDDFIEVKVHRDGVGTTTARKIVKQGAKVVVSGHDIQPGAKKIFEENEIIYFENVDAADLDTDSEVE